MKEGSIPEDWKSSVVLPIYKGKGDPMECGSYRGIKLLEHAMKVVERIFKHRIRQQIEIDDMQFRFMWRCQRNPMFSSFRITRTCDGRTDGNRVIA